MDWRTLRYLLMLGLLGGSVLLAPAQIHYSHHFTKKLQRMAGEFIEPVEGFYKVKMLRKDAYMRYDLVIHSEDYAMEMRFSLQPKYQLNAPHISCFTLANSLASNDEHFDIKMHFFAEEEAEEYFHADWAAYADFVPKRSLTERYYARLVTIFHEEHGLMHTLLLFDEHHDEKQRRMYTLSFKQPSF